MYMLHNLDQMKNKSCKSIRQHSKCNRLLSRKKDIVMSHMQDITDDTMMNMKHKHSIHSNTLMLNNLYRKLLILNMWDSSSHKVQQYQLSFSKILPSEHNLCLKVLCFDLHNKMCNYWLILNISNKSICKVYRHKFLSSQELELICKLLLDKKYCNKW